MNHDYNCTECLSRLSVAENRMNTLEDHHRELKLDNREIKEDLKALQKTIWLASGGVALLVFMINVIVKLFPNKL